MSLSWKLGLATLIVVLAGGLLVQVDAQLLSQFTENPCVHKLNCRECIHTAGCGWCTKPDLGDVKRCFQPSVQKNLCPEPFIYYPENNMKILKNVTLSSISSRSAMGSSQGGYGMSYAQNSSMGSSYSAYSESEMRNSLHGQASQQSKSKSYASASSSQKFVQIYPQHVSIKLRLSKSNN